MDFDRSEGAAAVDSPWPMVGRGAQHQRALAALRGPARTVALHGASGVGKSRLAAEVAADLEQDGWLAAGVSGNSALSTVPLTTLAPVLARDTTDPIASAADAVALYTAARTTLSEIARGRRILLVLEDAAFADAVSVALIAQLVESGHLRVLSTVAEGEGVPERMTGIVAAPDAVWIDLPALDADQTAELLELALGAPVAPRAAATLHRASAGNPLFLRELVIAARDAGTLVHRSERWQLIAEPASAAALPELIRTRLRTLTPEERDAVERLALCQSLSLDEFARPGAPEALADLEQRGIVQVHEVGARMHVLLTHPQYAAAVRESVPRMRRRTLLGEQADLVARRGPSPADKLRVALWRLDAGRPDDPELLLRSARLAQQVHDPRSAERLVSASIAAGGDDAATHVLHAELLWTLTRRDDALRALDRAETRLADAPGRGGVHTAATSLRQQIRATA